MGLPVRCHPGDTVGQYVPFYFCSRSVMLYLLHRGNHPEVNYCGGQEPIVHLEADLRTVVDWAQAHGRRWAFTLSNAGAYYAEFRDSLEALDEIRWDAVMSNCLVPGFDGVILSLEWKEAIWARFVTGAPRPRTPSEQQYSDRRLRSRR